MKREHRLVPKGMKKKIAEIREKKGIPEKVWQSIKRAGGVKGPFVPPGQEVKPKRPKEIRRIVEVAKEETE